MDNNEVATLFRSISKILSNQDELMKHFGLNRHSFEWGYEDTETGKLKDDCYCIALRYEDMDRST